MLNIAFGWCANALDSLGSLLKGLLLIDAEGHRKRRQRGLRQL